MASPRPSDAENKSATTQAKDTAADAAETATERAGKAAGDAGDKVKEKTSDLKDQAKQQAQQQVDHQKERASEQISGVARALRKSGETLRDEDQGFLADYVDQAAGRVEDAADYVSKGSLSDFSRDLQRYARRQPIRFLGGALALGLAGGRFLKSSSPEDAGSERPSYGEGRGRTRRTTAQRARAVSPTEEVAAQEHRAPAHPRQQGGGVPTKPPATAGASGPAAMPSAGATGAQKSAGPSKDNASGNASSKSKATTDTGDPSPSKNDLASKNEGSGPKSERSDSDTDKKTKGQ